MTFNYLNYKGNAIFRNQPNHTYFDKSLEDGMDPLFLLLNDIDPYFWQPEQKAKRLEVSIISVVDPRTQKSITHLEYDHTKDEKCSIFQSPKCSTLTVMQHKMCVQALNCLQHGQAVEEESLYHWYSTQNIRLKEKERFQTFVAEFCQTNFEHMHTPCRKLLDLYQRWYKSRSRKLMRRYLQESYNTHLGLPHVRLCKNVLKEMQVQICKPEIVATVGVSIKWEENSCQQLGKLKYSLDSYLQTYMNSEDKQDELEEELHKLFVNKIDEEEPTTECPLFYIPLESLLFLLTAGDYVDLPMEMLLNIKDISNEGNENQKVIIMDLPLPSRQAGWHSYQQVAEQAVLAVLSINQLKQNEQINEKIQNQAPMEISNIYKVFTFEEYMQNCTASPDQLCQFSKTLIKWQLKPSEEDTHFNIYTSISNNPVGDDAETLFSLKLEYKPQFGCELKTKFQLLKEWVYLKLLQRNKMTCFRLDITNYKTLLQENVDVQKIEDYLSKFYNINCQQLLGNLFEFLKMLHGMPSDHYMLRFNSKFKDKLMLCKPSKEITQNTIHLHQLLETDVKDILFISQQCFLPIDDNLCSLMHLQHNIIPAAFSPQAVVPKVNLQTKFSKKFYERRKTSAEQQKLKNWNQRKYR